MAGTIITGSQQPAQADKHRTREERDNKRVNGVTPQRRTAPTATNPNNTPTAATRANTPTTRRANGTTRKLAPWETPEPETTADNNDATRQEPTPTPRADNKQDAPAPQWDAPIIIDAPLQL